jgi:alpha-glucosidase
MLKQPWWRGCVIYQVYPRSFMDANNDGIGDLQGIISKLDYIKSLNVDAIWISPFFKSPMKDFGYDISDYRAIDPMFGSMQDFEQLLAKSKALGLKLIIDQVLSHTSDQHEWFIQSRENKTNAKADWYVWADAKDDGTPPNNWLSIFGGSAWQWDSRRRQYYLHNFLSSQPDLNFHNEQVQQHVLENVQYWLDKGVDGFRLDAINFCFHDALLRDNPAKSSEDRKGRGFSEDNPYAYQYHYFNNTQPENLAFLEKIRLLMDKYENRVTLGEISSEDSLQTMCEYTADHKRLHMAYSFELLSDDFSPAYISSVIQQYEAKASNGWPCWAIGNHDVARVMTRWGKGQQKHDFAIMLNKLLGCLRGSVCCYQGEELGLEEADVEFEDLQDPYGIAFWPNYKGRDGCRTPMPWHKEQHQLGFSSADKTWLPVTSAYSDSSVAEQELSTDSVLNHYRTFYAWRKQQPALLYGDIEFVLVTDNVLGFIRKNEQQQLYILANFSNQVQNVCENKYLPSKLILRPFEVRIIQQ